MKGYFLSVICGAVLCAIVSSLMEKKGASGTVLKLICGVFLTFTVIQPITKVKLDDFAFYTSELTEDARYTSAIGEEQAKSAISAIIKQETEAYILDKASALHGIISVDVTVDGSMLPQSVTITGQLSPYAKLKLSEIMEVDLGIAKENQVWNE